MKVRFWFLSLGIVIAMVLGACGRGNSAKAAPGGGSQGNQQGSRSSGGIVAVHTNATDFVQPSVTLHAGDSIKLVNDASVVHVIGLGTWKHGVAQPEKEPGAPNVQNQQLAAHGSTTIGPWTTRGTYHLYCSVHVDMQMTVYVK